MFAVTSIIESSNPYLFYSIKEFLNQDLPKDFTWFIYISDSNPSKYYLNDTIRTFKHVKFVVEKIHSNYLNTYNSSLWTMPFEIFGSLMIYAYLGIFRTTEKVYWKLIVSSI